MATPTTALIPVPEIQQRIHVVRGKRVMLDADLARFYGVTTFNLNKAVSRNLDRFPDDFSFILTREEVGNLIFQSGISKRGHGGRRTTPRVFTEQGVAMQLAHRCPLLRARYLSRELRPPAQTQAKNWRGTMRPSPISSKPCASCLGRPGRITAARSASAPATADQSSATIPADL